MFHINFLNFQSTGDASKNTQLFKTRNLGVILAFLDPDQRANLNSNIIRICILNNFKYFVANATLFDFYFTATCRYGDEYI
jgi:hypothetical protein